jgi:hypothetical protein
MDIDHEKSQWTLPEMPILEKNGRFGKTRVRLRGGQIMAKNKKTRTVRPWTATDLRILKGLAKQKVGVAKISKSLKRTVGAVTMMASKKGISLSMRE